MAPSRGLSRCVTRNFTTTPRVWSGHNRWSKIKHDKARVDASKTRQRAQWSHEIALASKLFGPDPTMNPRLADLITKVKREGFPKNTIEAAIARGQGRSTTGASLESVTVEGMLPNNVAVIVDSETDSKLRTLGEIRLLLKEYGGSATPTGYLFEKKGRIVFEKKDGITADDALEAALEAGAIDVVDDDDGRVVVFTECGHVTAVGQALSQALDLQISASSMIWDANEDTKVNLSSADLAAELGAFVDELHERESAIQSVAMNVAQGELSADAWKELQSRIN